MDPTIYSQRNLKSLSFSNSDKYNIKKSKQDKFYNSKFCASKNSEAQASNQKKIIVEEDDKKIKNSEEKTIMALTQELSTLKENMKILRSHIIKQFFSQKKQIPSLNLHKMIKIHSSPTSRHRLCISTSRSTKEKIKLSLNTVRDSASNEGEGLKNEKLKFYKLERYFKFIINSLNKICKQTSEDESSKITQIQNIIDDCSLKLNKIDNSELNFSSEYQNMKEELEKSKKIALKYEKKLKIKNETILIMRSKVKEAEDNVYKLKIGIQTGIEAQELLFDKFLLTINERISENDKKFAEIREMIRRRLSFGLEEIKKVVEMTNKNAFYDEQFENYKKNIEQNELNNKTIFEKMRRLEDENGKYKSKIVELEKIITVLKTEEINSKMLLNEIDSLSECNDKLNKQLKMKEFELKQSEFEKKELDSDKSSLLSKVESLEIEIIESREDINTLNIRYNQEIETLIYSNTVQKNEINLYSKEKNELIKQSEILEKNLNEISQKYNDLNKDSHNFYLILEEKDHKIKECYKKIETYESTNKLLIDDNKNKYEKYKEIFEDLKLDAYELRKFLNEHKDEFSKIQEKVFKAEDKIEQLEDINKKLEIVLSEASEKNMIINSTNATLLQKIIELEEDIKNLTSKLLKKNNENSILEDQLMVYSPRSRGSATNESDLREENLKMRCELLELHKSNDQLSQNLGQCQLNLNLANNMINEYKLQIQKYSEDLENYRGQCVNKVQEQEKLENQLADCKCEIEKISKLNKDLSLSIRNKEFTYNTNMKYMEDQLKKYKSDYSSENKSFIITNSQNKDSEDPKVV